MANSPAPSLDPVSTWNQAVANRGDLFDFSQPNGRRAFVLLALGSVLGLGIAGYGLFTAKGTATNRLPPEDIALVNQKPIYRSDFILQTQTQYAVPFEKTTHAQRQKVVDDMVNEELMVQRGIEVDLPGYDPEVRAALVNGVELQMYADVLAKQPTEEELKTYYQQHRDKYASIGVMRLRDLMLNVRSGESNDQLVQRAQIAITKLRQGAQLDGDFLQKNGLRDSGKLMQSGEPDLGDIFDFAAQANLNPKVYASALKLQPGQVSEPIDDADGVHIVVMTARKAPRPQGYEAVRPRVWTDIKNDAQERIKNAGYQYLRSKAEILTADSSSY
jgi:hypothetical protein